MISHTLCFCLAAFAGLTTGCEGSSLVDKPVSELTTPCACVQAMKEAMDVLEKIGLDEEKVEDWTELKAERFKDTSAKLRKITAHCQKTYQANALRACKEYEELKNRGN